MEKLLSVIIPTYNREHVLERSLNSVLEHTPGNMEIIVVDDASTDNTQALLRSRYPQVRVIVNKATTGPGFSRNAGIEAATGTNLFFLDADDWLEKGALAKLLDVAGETGADVVACGIRKVWEDGRNEPYVSWEFSCSGGMPALEYYITYQLPAPAWNKLYRRDLIMEKNLRFDPVYYHEDVLFAAYIALYCRKYVSIKDFLINYFQHENSIVNRKPTPLHLASYIKQYKDFMDFAGTAELLQTETGRKVYQRILKAHCSIQFLPKLIRYAETRSRMEWEEECVQVCVKLLGAAAGYAMTDILTAAVDNFNLAHMNEHV
ncbi:MAG: glycosyltransferase [Deltaproteobacteria bacterium]|jgi:glycosyltransferase involved in cell wall biosynthesis|nr:glycosyltransferase [Deltaproteobacteria bacterium]